MRVLSLVLLPFLISAPAFADSLRAGKYAATSDMTTGGAAKTTTMCLSEKDVASMARMLVIGTEPTGIPGDCPPTNIVHAGDRHSFDYECRSKPGEKRHVVIVMRADLFDVTDTSPITAAGQTTVLGYTTVFRRLGDCESPTGNKAP